MERCDTMAGSLTLKEALLSCVEPTHEGRWHLAHAARPQDKNSVIRANVAWTNSLGAGNGAIQLLVGRAACGLSRDSEENMQ